MEEKLYLGVDWGTKRIGLAMGNNITGVASPYGVVAGLYDLMEVVKKEGIDKIIIGEPLKMKDNKLETDPRYRDFLDILKEETELPIVRIDERLSSKHADSLVGDKKTKADRDAVAAMLILQSYFDQK